MQIMHSLPAALADRIADTVTGRPLHALQRPEPED